MVEWVGAWMGGRVGEWTGGRAGDQAGGRVGGRAFSTASTGMRVRVPECVWILLPVFCAEVVAGKQDGSNGHA